MKRRRNQRLKCLNYLLAGVILLLGFPSCLDDTDSGLNEQYGSENSRYTIKGKVINKENKVVPDIQLIVKGLVRTTSYSEYERSVDTLYSDTKGEFLFKNVIIANEMRYSIIHRDIDKQGNIKTYLTDTVDVPMPDPSTAINNLKEGTVIANIEIILKENTLEENNQ